MQITHLVTHSGGFHADELLSSVILTRLHPEAEILRTRDAAWITPGSRATTSCIRTLAAALSRTGTACEFEVPLGVGNSLSFEVTWRCNMETQNCPPDRPGPG